MSRRGKQAVYFFVYLVILSAIGGLFYLKLRPVPSCTNGRQDSGEENVDCGGVCSNLCVKNLWPIEQSGNVFVFAPDSSHIELFVKLVNNNSAAGAKRLPYSFKITTVTGGSYKIAGSTYIYPDEVKNLVLIENAPPASALPANAEISLGAPEWARANDFMRPKIRIVNKKTTENGEIRVEGEVADDDGVSFNNLRVFAVFYDKHSQVAGVSATTLAQIAPGELKAFQITHPLIKDVQLSQTFVGAEALRP